VQSVNAAWTAEERDSVRSIGQSSLISWHKQSTLGNRTFTIGVSTIGSNDFIGVNSGAIGSPNNYKYFDETNYVTSLSWERSLTIPLGGLTKSLAEINLDNTSGRFTPRYMGGNSELYTSSYLPTRPAIINAGFKLSGVNVTVPQFAGLTSKQAIVDSRNKTVKLSAQDYVSYFENKYTDKAVMFTAQRTDQVLATLFTQAGMNTAQYDLDYGVNTIPFGYFPAGSKFAEVIKKLAEAENGHIYQDEAGIFKFENRQHWDSSPYTNVQRIITTAQVINAASPDTSHLVNVVEVNAKIRGKEQNQQLFSLSDATELQPMTDTELFVSFDDPILAIDTPTIWQANTLADGSGTNKTSSVIIKSVSKFAQAMKIVFTNNFASTVYLTSLVVTGRPARVVRDLHYRAQDDSSVTAYQEAPITIDNDYIQNDTWAATLAQMVLNTYSDPEKLQKITIRAIPELQLGDLVSWQGRSWRVYDIKSTLNPSAGYTQELLLLQRDVVNYFRIGLSYIGSTDKIAP